MADPGSSAGCAGSVGPSTARRWLRAILRRTAHRSIAHWMLERGRPAWRSSYDLSGAHDFHDCHGDPAWSGRTPILDGCGASNA